MLNRIENRDACLRSIRFGNRGGVSNSRAKSGRNADELFVEQRYCRPVGKASAGPLSMC